MLKQQFHKNLIATLSCLAIIVSLTIPTTAEARVKVDKLILQLTAVVADGPQVNLQWTQNDSASISGFEIARSLDPLSGYSVIHNAGSRDKSYVDQSVSPGQAYYYKIRAYKRSTYSAYSNVEFADIPADAPQDPVDTTPPSVALVNPSDNSSFNTEQVVNMSADATDDTAIDRVDFFCNDILVGSDSTAPYAYGWSISQNENGQHNLKAKAYDKSGNESVSASKTVTVDIVSEPSAPAEYTSPVLNSVQDNGGGSFTLNWSLPESAYGEPAGGYDVFTDGVDDNQHHTAYSTTVSGLQEGVEHCFQVEARWTQADPSVFPKSNQLCSLTSDTSAPSVSITSPADGTSYTSAQTVSINASAQDNVSVSKVEFFQGSILVGSDTSAPYSFGWPITETDNGTHSFTAKAYDAAGNSKVSAPVSLSVNVQAVTAEYTVPVLDYVQASGSDFLLGWSQPETAYGAPAGGYDLIIDGVDDNSHRTQQTAVVSGLTAGVEHCFVVEARWTQADPPVYPRSNQLCGTLEDVPTEDPEVPSGPVKVFPGAEGFGTDSVAGRGGQIIHVTNLNDSGAGSLREAVSTPGPRIVVFDVSGVIYLQSMLRISEPFITIAGQTAPGDGIMLRDYGVKISTNDVLIQHIAVRPGDEGAGPFDTLDGMQIVSPSYNIVIDHVSISWGVDENADTWTDVRDVTFSNNIISEGLYNSFHSDGDHSKGYLAGRRNKNIAFIGNLMAHNDSRNPMIYGETEMLMVNNVFYNAGAYSFSSIGDGWSDGPPQVTAVGNVYLSGPDTTAYAAIKIESSCPSGTRVYVADNHYNAGSIVTGQTQYLVSTPPVPYSDISIVSGESNILQKALANAGSRPVSRDSTDDRIANPVSGEVINGTGSWADCVSGCTNDAGGWPVYKSESRVFDAGVDPHGDDNGNGYTNVEEILYQLASQLEPTL